MKDQKISMSNKIIIGVAIVISVAIIFFAINKNSASSTPGKYDSFAQCLTDNGAVMYGAAWCTHCKEQKAAFGDSFRLIKYVECPDNTQLCIDKGIQGYPTWLIGTSTKIEGFDESNMKKLSDATQCPLP